MPSLGFSLGSSGGVANIPDSAPVNTVVPVVTGDLLEGSTLTTTNGTWAGSPTPSYTYQWRYAHGSGDNIGFDITGATAQTLELTTETVNLILSDPGSPANEFDIFCIVTADNDIGSPGVAQSVNQGPITYTPRLISAPVFSVDGGDPLNSLGTVQCPAGTWLSYPTITGFDPTWTYGDAGTQPNLFSPSLVGTPVTIPFGIAGSYISALVTVSNGVFEASSRTDNTAQVVSKDWVVVLANENTWPVPVGFGNPGTIPVLIECYGAGSDAVLGTGGGGAGAYARTSFMPPEGNGYQFQVAGANSNMPTVFGVGGPILCSAESGSGRLGGDDSLAVGDTHFGGGDGGLDDITGAFGGGGGGSAGPSGAGGNGADGTLGGAGAGGTGMSTAAPGTGDGGNGGPFGGSGSNGNPVGGGGGSAVIGGSSSGGGSIGYAILTWNG